MKQVYTYSQKQFDLERDLGLTIKFVDDKVFTQQQSSEDDQPVFFSEINGFDDNIIVHISENLLVDSTMLNFFGFKTCDTSQENTKYTIP